MLSWPSPARWIVLTLTASILTGFGFLLLILPGLIAAAYFMPLTSVIMFEHDPWGGLRRSVNLARGHVMPLIGVLLMVVGIGIVVLSPVIYLLATTDAAGFIGLAVAAIGGAAISALYSVVSYFVYLRLRALSGEGGHDVSNVFE